MRGALLSRIPTIKNQGIANMNYQKQWVERSDNCQGYVYLVEAEDFNGWFPGKLIRRVKIGLTRNVSKRLDEFHSNQPPCNIKLIKAIYVDDMAAIESELHRQFKHCNVKLLKSREWFDLSPWQLQRCLFLMNQYDSEREPFKFSPKLILGSAIALLGIGLMVRHNIITPHPSATTATNSETSTLIRHVQITKKGK